MTIRPLRAELFHVDGRTDGETQTDHDEANSCNFANAPKNAKVK